MYDSVGRAPLPGALVQVVPLDPTLRESGRRTAESDRAGHFGVDVPPGRYLVGFLHPKLDSLGVDPPLRRVDVRGPHTIDLAVPSPRSIVQAWCGSASLRDSTGVVLGHVRDAHSGQPVDGGVVEAQWSAITLTAGGARASVQRASAQASALGWFGMCGVPRGGVLVLRASVAGDSTGLLELDVPDDGVLLRDVLVSRSAAPPLPGRVRGVVRDPAGDPVSGARVRVSGGTGEVRTLADGSFQLATQGPGSMLLDVRMIGFVPMRRVVDVVPLDGAALEVTMQPFPTEIDTVRVLSRRPAFREAQMGFEARRQLGHGEFLDAETIERRRPLVFTDLLRGLPGTEVRTVDLMTRVVQMRSSDGRGACTPVVVLDGVRLPAEGTTLDDVIPAELVRAVEVYPRRIQAPPEYQTAECGSIVVWTGVRGWLARPGRGSR